MESPLDAGQEWFKLLMLDVWDPAINSHMSRTHEVISKVFAHIKRRGLRLDLPHCSGFTLVFQRPQSDERVWLNQMELSMSQVRWLYRRGDRLIRFTQTSWPAD